jgi:undecaprenyl-diphosphatase
LEFFHLLALSLIQGLTEFLPISSSAHLILLPQLMGWQDQGLAYDIAAHLGTLLAVAIYFRRDLAGITRGGMRSLRPGTLTDEGRLFWLLLLACVPVALVGWLMYETAATDFRNPLLIAGANLVFALLLWLADARGKRLREVRAVTFRDAVVIGLAQALSIVPGTSRSGVTMTAGLMLGLTREASARFSFLLAVPVILMAGGYELYRVATIEAEADPALFTLVVLISGASALAAIHFFLRWLERYGMLPYVIYRLGLGVVLISYFA